MSTLLGYTASTHLFCFNPIAQRLDFQRNENLFSLQLTIQYYKKIIYIVQYMLYPHTHAHTPQTYICSYAPVEKCILSNNVMDYHIVSQGKTTIPGLDDGEELTLTEVRSTADLDFRIESELILQTDQLIFSTYQFLHSLHPLSLLLTQSSKADLSTKYI